MTRKNTVKEKLQRGEVVFGCHVMILDPSFAEILGLAGFDFLMMDGEHCPLSVATLEHMVRACETAGTIPMGKLPINDPPALLPYLDTGIMGAQVPHCNTAADAVRLVEGVKYPPIGNRGVASVRASRYGAVPTADHVRQWNEEMLALLQVEDAEALPNLAEMMAVPGIDVIAIGLADLASSMGHPGDVNHSAVQETVARLVREIRDAGLWVTLAPRSTDPDETKRYIDMGVQMIKYVDILLLREKALSVLERSGAKTR